MTTSTAIIIVGLGPGRWEDLTLEARALLEQAASENRTVYFRTLVHPTVEPIGREMANLRMESFNSFYDEPGGWDTLYQRIAEEICTLAEQQPPVIYAVPGHPLIGEASVQLILQQARQRGLSTKIPLLVAQIHNRRLASAVKLALGECYPDEWPVKLVRTAGVDSGETDEMVVEVPLYELDRISLANHMSTLYVPPVDELQALRLPETLRYVTARLRREPDGCPWDRRQTHQSLTRYAIEETYEVVEALEENDMEKLAEELGDLLLQVYLHAEIARQEGDFNIGDVFEHVNAKLIRRHPHVFGEVVVENAGQVVQNWEEIKRQERIAAGKDVKSESILEGVHLAAPALIVAQEYQKRVARAGFDFPDLQGALAKLAEELRELQEAVTPEHQREEMGDVLFMVAEMARILKIDAEEALRLANQKFRQRFQAMERIIREEERAFSSYSLEEWIELWRRAKELAA